jgi:elongation factor Tu
MSASLILGFFVRGRMGGMIELLADLQLVATADGGRNSPFTSGYRPQFYFEGVDFDCTIQVPEGKWLQSGASARATIILSQYASKILAGRLLEGCQFSLREGPTTIASGTALSTA